MAGLYYNLWSCTQCDFHDKTISGPFRVEAKAWVYKSIIEDRFCHDCNGIRRCFTGNAGIYNFRDFDYEPGLDMISKWRWESRENILFRIKKLEKNKRINLFFSFLKKAKELSQLKYRLKQCDELNTEAEVYYNKYKPKPRCLICGTENISHLVWNKDYHSCGGMFVQKDSGRVASVGRFDIITYDENGYVHHILESVVLSQANPSTANPLVKAKNASR